MGLSYEDAKRCGIENLHPLSRKSSLTRSGESIVMHIVDWNPTRLNQLVNANRYASSRMKAADRDRLIQAYGNEPKAKFKRRVELLITLKPRRRAADTDAYWKSLLDGLKLAGAIVDDNYLWVETSPVTYARGERDATTITLTDIGTVEFKPRKKKEDDSQ